jgi:hypothetical protein
VTIASSIMAATSIAPHYRLYTNRLGGGLAKAGYYFPHDEFYDASLRDGVFEVARRARPGARVASETPGLAAYYAERAGRSDLVAVQLSDPKALKQLTEGDFIINTRGRRYFSNDELLSALQRSSNPAVRINLNGIPSAEVYELDQNSLKIVAAVADHMRPVEQNLNMDRAAAEDERQVTSEQ